MMYDPLGEAACVVHREAMAVGLVPIARGVAGGASRFRVMRILAATLLLVAIR